MNSLQEDVFEYLCETLGREPNETELNSELQTWTEFYEAACADWEDSRETYE